MKLRLQKKQIKKIMRPDSYAKKYSQKQLIGFVSRLSKKGRDFS